MALERTLSIVKPDGVGRNLIGEVYRRFEKAGLRSLPPACCIYLSARPKDSTRCIASGRSSRTWCAT